MLWTLFIMSMWAGGMINTSMMVGVFLSGGLLPRISDELRRAEIHGEGPHAVRSIRGD